MVVYTYILLFANGAGKSKKIKKRKEKTITDTHKLNFWEQFTSPKGHLSETDMA